MEESQIGIQFIAEMCDLHKAVELFLWYIPRHLMEIDSLIYIRNSERKERRVDPIKEE